MFEQKVRNKKLQSYLLEVLSCREVRKLERLDDDLCRKLRNSIDQLEEEGERELFLEQSDNKSCSEEPVTAMVHF